MRYKNMKIAITDEAHLKAVCDVLGSLGYVSPNSDGNVIYTSDTGNTFNCYGNLALDMDGIYENTTLTDLLKMRNEMVYKNAKGKKMRVRVQSGQDLTGKIDFSEWIEIR